MKNQPHRGFTLIELIVVIAIIAILVTIVVLAINPAEQLARSRDAKRTADLDTLRAAFNLYMAQATGTVSLDGVSGSSANDKCTGGSGVVTMFISGGDVATTSPFTATSTGTQVVGSAGWAPARLNDTPGGAPVSNLPVDPTNNCSRPHSGFCYIYACKKSPLTYEFTATMESSYFATDIDVDNKDGGNAATSTEVGTDLTILPAGY